MTKGKLIVFDGPVENINNLIMVNVQSFITNMHLTTNPDELGIPIVVASNDITEAVTTTLIDYAYCDEWYAGIMWEEFMVSETVRESVRWISEQLEAGNNVLCGKWLYSILAFSELMYREFHTGVKNMTEHNLLPDHTIIINMPVEITLASLRIRYLWDENNVGRVTELLKRYFHNHIDVINTTPLKGTYLEVSVITDDVIQRLSEDVLKVLVSNGEVSTDTKPLLDHYDDFIRVFRLRTTK